MSYLGGGERLCCETIRVLLSTGHEVTILSEAFNPQRVQNFFGYNHLFDSVHLAFYTPQSIPTELGSSAHLLHHAKEQKRVLRRLSKAQSDFDLLFSTQDPGYIPDMSIPVIQWGYFPRLFPNLSSGSPRATVQFLRTLPLRFHYKRKIERIGLILAISEYSKSNLDKWWKRPSRIIFPACNMVDPRVKSDLVVTVSRAVPIKRLEIFWQIARLRPQYEFMMLLTQDPNHSEYSRMLMEETPGNGSIIFNPSREEYHRVLGKARVYLHLMKNEHFGITIVEAMSAQCTPIVHDSGGPREIVDPTIGFLWQKVDDIPSMLDLAMKKPLSDSLRRKAETFSVQEFERRISSILSELPVRNPQQGQGVY